MVIASFVLVAPAQAHAKPRPKWLPKIWYAIGMCETRLNWRHNTQSYEGAFGFYRGSWDDYKPRGYPGDAWMATPKQQYRVARIIHSRFGYTGWGCYTNGNYRVFL